MYNNVIYENLNKIQRKIVDLRDKISRKKLSKGQEKFLFVYMDMVGIYLEKSFDVLDLEHYKELLLEIEE